MATPYQPQHDEKAAELGQFMTDYVTKTIIPTFKEQTRGKQYAVIDLWTQTDVLTKFKHHFRNVSIDSAMDSMPSESEYTNHIVARPQKFRKGKKTKHSEIILMDKLDSLYTAFKLHTRDDSLVAIFLYSYFMPCTDCSRAIISKLSTLEYSHLPVFIVYSKPYRHTDIEAATLLHTNNIFLYRVSQ